jgi:hypothetical protein
MKFFAIITVSRLVTMNDMKNSNITDINYRKKIMHFKERSAVLLTETSRLK